MIKIHDINGILKKILLYLFLIIVHNCFSQQLETIDSNYIKIGNQIWMKTNLQVTIFRNGDTIMHTKNIIEWQFANKNKIPAWCYYNNDEINSTKLGKLYNWFAIIDKRGIAPKGWHIPTKVDFNNLINELGGHKKDLLKLAKTHEWPWPKDCVINESGFNALPSGCLSCLNSKEFNYISASAFFWTSSFKGEDSYILMLNGDFPCIALLRNINSGFSVRCLKD